MGCVKAGGREREMWCWWNCKYQPWAPRPFQHPQVSFTVSERRSNGPVYWLLRRSQLSSCSLLLTNQPSRSHLTSRKILSPQIMVHTKLTGLWKITPDRFAFIISMIDWSQNRVKIFCWGVKSQHTWLMSDSIRIGIIQGYRALTVNHADF